MLGFLSDFQPALYKIRLTITLKITSFFVNRATIEIERKTVAPY